MSSELLFGEIELGPYTLPNRIVMAPMTRSRSAQPGNIPTTLNAHYYAQRASAGLIISEATQVSQQGQGYAWTPGIHTPEQVQGWKQVTEAVHDKGSRIFAQLWHVGRISHPALQPDGGLPVAPSAIAPPGEAFITDADGNPALVPFVTPRALATEEIAAIVRQFANGAQNALATGFDGIEIHAANGYLLDQFINSSTNQRQDQYGGSVENRARLLFEVVDAVARVWGADGVGIRLSPLGTFNGMGDADPEATFAHIAERLNGYGLAYLHVVDPRGAGTDPRAGHIMTLIRERYHGTLIVAGGYDAERAAAALAQDEADLVAFARAFLANPDLPERFRRRAPLNRPDPATFYGGSEKGYTDYPTLDQLARAS